MKTMQASMEMCSLERLWIAAIWIADVLLSRTRWAGKTADRLTDSCELRPIAFLQAPAKLRYLPNQEDR